MYGGGHLCCKMLKFHRTHTGGEQTSLENLLSRDLIISLSVLIVICLLKRRFLVLLFTTFFSGKGGPEISTQVWEFLIYLD